MYEDLFHIAGANGFHARHIRIAGAAGLAFDFTVFFAAALGSVFGLGSVLGFAFASACAAGVAGVAAAASCLNEQFSREHDPVFLKVNTLGCSCDRTDLVSLNEAVSPESSWSD